MGQGSFEEFQKIIAKLQKGLEKLRHGPLAVESRSKMKDLQALIENLLDQEELVWLQRGRVNWLMHVDRNMSFFHKAASARRKINYI